jgi:hypothetical protein
LKGDAAKGDAAMLSPREQMNRSLDALLALWAVLDATRLKDGGGPRLRVPRKT